MTSLISESYLAQQRHLHETMEYGVVGFRWAETVRLISQSGRKTILDYGCGQQTLKQILGPAFKVACYDPALEGLDEPPEPADVVVCTDVLEHVEPECLDAVIADIARLTKELALLAVHTGPAKKILPDGRNAHLIQEGSGFWMRRFLEHFEPLKAEWYGGKEFMAICRPIRS
jgi:hypothetical protein